MKYILLILIAISTIGSSVNSYPYAMPIGEVCYSIYPPNAPQDNAVEKLYVVQRIADPKIFDSVGYHEDSQNIRTPIHATSYYDTDLGVYTRTAYGVLGNIRGELYNADQDDVFNMFYSKPRTAIFLSHSSLSKNQDTGMLEGTFKADVWHHDFEFIQMVPGMNNSYGVIRQIDCNDIDSHLE